jgi:hypothetical protein
VKLAEALACEALTVCVGEPLKLAGALGDAEAVAEAVAPA